MKLPSVLVHVASGEQLSVPTAHSSISISNQVMWLQYLANALSRGGGGGGGADW